MKKIKFLALALSLLVLATVFVGCNNTNNNASNEKEPTSNTLNEDKPTDTKSKVYTVGTNAEFPPFEFMNDKGEPDGFDMELIKECAKVAGIEVKIENMNFDSLIAAMETGKIDVIASGMTITDERKGEVDFTEPYYTAVQKIILKKGDESIKGVKDLNGKRIAVQDGTTGDIIATNNNKGKVDPAGVLDAKVTRLKKGVDAVMDLKNGRVDCVLIDKNPAEEFVKANPDIYAIDSGCAPENYGFAVKKGNKELLDKLNAALNTLKENKKYDEIYKKFELDKVGVDE